MHNSLMKEYKNIIDNIEKGQYTDNRKLLDNIKRYLANPKTRKNKDAIKCQKKLAKILYNEYTKEEVINSFNISSDNIFLRDLSIIQNDPLFKNPYLFQVIEDTITIDDNSKYYPEDIIMYFLTLCKESFIHDPNFNDVNFKLDKLKVLESYVVFKETHTYSGHKVKMESLNEEIKKYIRLSVNKDYDNEEFEKFSLSHKDDNAFEEYKAIKKENLCKLKLYESLIKKDYLCKTFIENNLEPDNVIFVTRDIGDNFGYDIYSAIHKDDIKLDTVYKVINQRSFDQRNFSLSKKEMEVMQSTINTPKAEYIVCIMYLDIVNTMQKNTFLIVMNETTFKDLESDEEYHFDNFDGKYFNFVSNKLKKDIDKIKKIEF